jgi:hypothetical protein
MKIKRLTTNQYTYTLTTYNDSMPIALIINIGKILSLNELLDLYITLKEMSE